VRDLKARNKPTAVFFKVNKSSYHGTRHKERFDSCHVQADKGTRKRKRVRKGIWQYKTGKAKFINENSKKYAGELNAAHKYFINNYCKDGVKNVKNAFELKK